MQRGKGKKGEKKMVGRRPEACTACFLAICSSLFCRWHLGFPLGNYPNNCQHGVQMAISLLWQQVACDSEMAKALGTRWMVQPYTNWSTSTCWHQAEGSIASWWGIQIWVQIWVLPLSLAGGVTWASYLFPLCLGIIQDFCEDQMS